MIAGEIGQIQRKTGAHDQGICTRCQCLSYVVLVGREGLHDIDRDQPIAIGNGPGACDFTVKRLEIRGIQEGATIRAMGGIAGAIHEIGMQSTQVNRGHRTDGAQAGHRTGQSAGRYSHAHAALNDRNKRLAAHMPGAQTGSLGQGKKLIGELSIVKLRLLGF